MTATPQPSPVRRLSGEDRRRQLIDTAMHLFSSRGFTGTTTREIAAAAGVTEALIFRFFPHKEDLYAAILERKSAEACTDEWVSELQTLARGGNPAAVIRNLVAHVLEHQRRDPEFLRLMMHSALESHSFARQYRERHFAPLRDFLIAFVRDQQRAGVFRPGHPQQMVRAIFALPAHDSLIETLMPDVGVPREDIVDFYTDFILAGLRTTPAVAS